MLQKIFYVALAAAALVAGAPSVDGLDRAANANDVVVAVAKPQGSGIKAEIRFIRELSGDGLQVDVSASGLTVGQQYPYHIHVNPVPSSGNCTATGGHLDPYGISAAAGKNYKCQPSDAAATCELGDLAGLYGKMIPDSKGNFVASYNATMLAFGGKNTILDHSVVIHASNLTRLACANIVGYVLSGSTTDKAADHESTTGDSMDKDSRSSGASARIAGLSAALLLLATAAFA